MISPFSRLALPTLALTILLTPADAGAKPRDLCTSVPSVCTYTGPNVPVLAAEVCYGPTTGLRLKGTAPCPSGSWPYFVETGEFVDPLTNEVVAYVPLDDACSQPELCVDAPPRSDPQQLPMCCDADYVCTHAVTNCNGSGEILYYCEDGVSNADGTITCFAAEPLD
ncbi:MAG: hypothetical protein R6X02_06510 [Enhygromyxa sp.]